MPEPLYHEEFGTLDLHSLPVVTEANVQEGSLLVMFHSVERYGNWRHGGFSALIWVVQEIVHGRGIHIQLIKTINAPASGEHDQWVTIKALSFIGYRVLS